jgi:CRISPR/Cas system-associated protein Csx1
MKVVDGNLIIGNTKAPVYITTFNDEGYSLVLTSAYFTQKITIDKTAAEQLYSDLKTYLDSLQI